MPTKITKTNNYEELLDSDDELPLEYNDISVTPAYQIDSRFDMIQFKWINNVKDYDNELPSSEENCTEENSTEENFTEENSSYASGIDIPVINIKSKLNLKPLVHRGIMKNHDLFCLKSIEGLTGDSILIWLINFFICKDLQSEYGFLKSCLVNTF